jgi:hypothetical protein
MASGFFDMLEKAVRICGALEEAALISPTEVFISDCENTGATSKS